MKKIAVVFTRGFDDTDLVEFTLKQYVPFVLITHHVKNFINPAVEFANKNRMPCKICYAFSDKYGRRAMSVRNNKIVNDSDEIVAFWDGESEDVDKIVKLAQLKMKKIFIVEY
jgi:hypothetical protein